MLTEKELEILLRRKKGESQAEIAQALDISQAAVSQFENNAKKKLIQAEQLRELLAQEGIRVEEGPLGKKVVWREKQ